MNSGIHFSTKKQKLKIGHFVSLLDVSNNPPLKATAIDFQCDHFSLLFIIQPICGCVVFLIKPLWAKKKSSLIKNF